MNSQEAVNARKRLRGGRNPGTEGDESSGSGDQMLARIQTLEESMRSVTLNVGEGSFKQPVTRALMQEIVNVNYRVANLEHAIYDSWELPEDNPITKEMNRWTQAWHAKCQEMKGKRDASLGSCKNFVFLGLLNAYILDAKQPEDKKEMLKTMAIEKCGDDEGKVVAMKAKSLHDIVKHAQITVVPKAKKAFINLSIRVETHREVNTILKKFLDEAGQRQYDPPPLQPRARDIRNALAQ
jgi:hypothetical protein